MTNAKDPFVGMRSFSDAVEGLWPDLDQRDTDDFLGQPVGILDFRTLTNKNWTGPYAIVKAVDGNGEQFTFGCSGAVIVRHLQEAQEKGTLPFVAALIKRWPGGVQAKGMNPYWLFADPNSKEAQEALKAVTVSK